MKIYDLSSFVKEFCRISRKWAVVLYPRWQEFKTSEHEKAILFLNSNTENVIQCLSDGQMIVVCDSEKECDHIYYSIVGDDGPTKLNPYDGPCRIYAWTCNSNGEIETENT